MPALGQICHCCSKISLEKTLSCKIGKLSLVAKTISGSLINVAIEALEAHRKQKHHEFFLFFGFFLLFLFSLLISAFCSTKYHKILHSYC